MGAPGQEIRRSLWRCRKFTWFFCALGLSLSCYAVHVEMSKENNPDYVALCDISEHMSCSAVFTSKYGKGLGLIAPIFGDTSPLNQPNGVYGIATYLLVLFCSLFNVRFLSKMELVVSIIANLTSVYLGYILFWILHDTCIVCVSAWVTNFFILICAIVNYRKVKKLVETIGYENDDLGYFSGSYKTKKRA